MNNLKCIFTDLDGTLLNSEHKILPNTKQILCDLYHNDVIIVPVSARMPATITSITDVIDTELPLIAYNGAYALNKYKNPIFSYTIDAKTSLDIYNYTKRYYPDVCICVYFENDWVVDDISDYRIQTEINAVGVIPDVIPIDKYINSRNKLHKLFVVGDPKRTDKLLNEINTMRQNVYACKSRDIFIEITSSDASKGNAVKQFAEKSGFNIINTIAFGDQINDIDMLTAVGAGVAMGNSVPEVKQTARYFTDTNDNEGIYKFLKNYIV